MAFAKSNLKLNLPSRRDRALISESGWNRDPFRVEMLLSRGTS